MRVRRVVTGQTTDGTSVIVNDEQLDPVTVGLLPGAEFFRLWGSDEPFKLPMDVAVPSASGWFPPPGGVRLALFTLGPDTLTMPENLNMEAALAEISEKLPGLMDVLEPENPGMHQTDTVDFVLVLAGEAWLELDAGAEVLLRAGDCLVQNGTRHAIRNKSSEPCVMAAVILGAKREM
jgi:mannose-6-phosphate isomerase-like protein (cupin superfamily)